MNKVILSSYFYSNIFLDNHQLGLYHQKTSKITYELDQEKILEPGFAYCSTQKISTAFTREWADSVRQEVIFIIVTMKEMPIYRRKRGVLK